MLQFHTSLKKRSLIIIFSLIFISCSLKTRLDAHNDPIIIVINDFIGSKIAKEDSVFNVLVTEENDLLVIGIMGAYDPIFNQKEYVANVKSDGIFPTNYVILDDKLFLWNEPNGTITEDIIKIIYKYDHIDTTWQNEYILPPYTINDGKRGVIYYLCKNNFKNFKKSYSNTIYKHYKEPTVKCK